MRLKLIVLSCLFLLIPINRDGAEGSPLKNNASQDGQKILQDPSSKESSLTGFKYKNKFFPLPDYNKNSSQWQARNSHLIPTDKEIAGIMKIDFYGHGKPAWQDDDLDGDGIRNSKDNDIDGDGVENQFDPSPYDPRETGYYPFAVLAFLNWDQAWNYYAFKGENLDKAVASMKKLGVGFVRMDFSWGDIEMEEGKFNFEKYDRIVDLLTKNNIRILAVLGYCAGWASSNPEFLWNYPPRENRFFTNYAARVVRHFKNRIKYWEIWNEPDSRAYWRPQDMLVKYSQLLKDTYVACKKEDPSCKILHGGLADPGKLYLLYNNGCKDYFDMANIHTLTSPLFAKPAKIVWSQVELAKKTMERNGDKRKMVWITEVGCPGVPKNLPIPNWWNGKNPNEKQQAGWVKQVFTEIPPHPGAEKIFWAFFRDTKAHFGNGVDYFGLIRWDFSEKPSYQELEKIIKNWQTLK